ncbi:MAG: hypothetical protein HY843_05585, partial [Bdellovibrio sp.]|nr:hypothetical protein [Bdellovibrio sp.]
MKAYILALCIIVFFQEQLYAQDIYLASDACSRFETWKFKTTASESHRNTPKNIQRNIQENTWINEFRYSVSGFYSPINGFVNALALRKSSKTTSQKIFAEYWISRSLFHAGFIQAAERAFSAIIVSQPSLETVEIQIAAIECLNRIHRLYRSFDFEPDLSKYLPFYLHYYSLTNLKKYVHFDEKYLNNKREILYEAMSQIFFTFFSAKRIDKNLIMDYLTLFQLGTDYRSNAFSDFAHGLWFIRNEQYFKAIAAFERLLKQIDTHAYLSFYKDQVHLFLARAYFSEKNYEKSIQHFKQVKKSSNELIKSLSELSWGYLQDEAYKETIGTTLNLESGSLIKTFAPETPMVMSMALNELCQFPESLTAMDLFKKNYEKSYNWLQKWFNTQELLYTRAVNFLNWKDNVPERVGSEWIRSPVFISHQDYLNLIQKEISNFANWSRTGALEQNQYAKQIKELILDIKPKIKIIRSQSKTWEPLPESLREKILELKILLSHYKRYQTAAGVFHVFIQNQKILNPMLQKKLIAEINKDLKTRSIKMLSQLEEIAENNQMIEVEIYNGASREQDMFNLGDDVTVLLGWPISCECESPYRIIEAY